jgi:hypothetical protein
LVALLKKLFPNRTLTVTICHVLVICDVSLTVFTVVPTLNHHSLKRKFIMQATSQLIQAATQAEVQAQQTQSTPAQMELSALQLALVGGGAGNAAFG